jgi:hypothetical protein
MRLKAFLRRAGWCGALGGLLLPAASLTAGEPRPFRIRLMPDHNVFFHVSDDTKADANADAEPAEPAADSYWIGLSCDADALSDIVRAQLGVPAGHGLVVQAVVDESPAAKAGFQANDVLLKAGDKDLTGLNDLVEAVQAAADKELAVELLRGGEKMTVMVTPDKRPNDPRFTARVLPEGDFGPEGERILKMLRDWRGDGRRFAFAVPHPGMMLPPGAGTHALPKDMSVSITKTGDEPAKITVKQGEQSWETTEDKLDVLPEDVRGHVAPMLNRNVLGMRVEVAPGVDEVAPPRVFRNRLGGDFDARFDELRDQMRKLQEAVEQLQQEHTKVKQ